MGMWKIARSGDSDKKRISPLTSGEASLTIATCSDMTGLLILVTVLFLTNWNNRRSRIHLITSILTKELMRSAAIKTEDTKTLRRAGGKRFFVDRKCWTER